MICTNKINRICIVESHEQVIVKDMTLDMALGACGLSGKVPYNTKHYRVRQARAKGTYDLARAAYVATLVADYAKNNRDIRGLVIDHNEKASSLALSSLTSTATMVTLSTGSSSEEEAPSGSPKKKKSRKSFRQASLEKLETKRAKTEYDTRYKTAFKDATNIVATARVATSPTGDEEFVLSMLHRLNCVHNLDGKKKLAKTTVYGAVDKGMAGMSPKKKVRHQEFLKTSLNW